MKYGFKKFFSSNDLNTTIGSIVSFDPNIVMDFTQEVYGNIGLTISDINHNISSLEGDIWMIVSYDENDVVLDQDVIIVSKYTNIYSCTNPDTTFLSYFDLSTLSAKGAYYCGLYLNQYDNCLQYIDTQEWASKWVKYVRPSDYDHFKSLIIDQPWIYFWATELDSNEFFLKLSDQELLYKYAVFFPDRKNTVISMITDPYWLNLVNSITIEPVPVPEGS